MRKAFLGFTFLIATLCPVGGYIAEHLTGGMHGVFGLFPPMWYRLFYLAMIYLPAAGVTAWFFRAAQLASRVPLEVPGSRLLGSGSILTALFVVVRLLASTIEGGGVGALVQELSPFILLPANVLLAVGAAKLLLSAKSSPLRTDAPQVAVEEY